MDRLLRVLADCHVFNNKVLAVKAHESNRKEIMEGIGHLQILAIGKCDS